MNLPVTPAFRRWPVGLLGALCLIEVAVTARAQLYEFTTIAGRASAASNDGLGNEARFSLPQGIAVDAAGNLFVGDSGNHAIRRITPAGAVTTFAGAAGLMGSVDGTGGGARFSGPQGVAVDQGGNVYVADTGSRTIRKITGTGIVTTLAGATGQVGSTDGTGPAARFGGPLAVALDGTGTLIVTDDALFGSLRSPTYQFAIRRVSAGGTVTTLIATTRGIIPVGSADGPSATAKIGEVRGVTVDRAGTIYFTDASNNAIRKVTTDGIVSTIAGFPPTGRLEFSTSGFANGGGAAARFASPAGITLDRDGNLVVADAGNHCIRKVTASGTVTTLAGAPRGIDMGADGVGVEAQFRTPGAVAVGSDGTVFVSDSQNFTIRKIAVDGTVTTFAGSARAIGNIDGQGAAARFDDVQGLALDRGGNLFVVDTGNRAIRKITPGGLVSTFFTTGGDGPGPPTPTWLAFDGAGNLLVTDVFSNSIWKITPAGAVTLLAGGSRGDVDGVGSAARFSGPWGIAVDGKGEIFVADNFNHTIRKITTAGAVTTFVGTPGSPGNADGTGAAARLRNPVGLAFDGSGNLFVGDRSNCLLRKITPAGVVTTVAGRSIYAGDTDGTGSAARFAEPTGIAVDAAGNVIIADAGNNSIRKSTPDGVVTTVAGGSPSLDGIGASARFNGPQAVAIDRGGTMYVADSPGHTIRKITPDGRVTTLAGMNGHSGNSDGPARDARFFGPGGVAVDELGNVYVADTLSSTIRKIALNGDVTTLAGAIPTSEIGPRGFADGVGRAARFDRPFSLAVDRAGNVFVADTSNRAIRKITPEGVVTTLAGRPVMAPLTDGPGSVARFSEPTGLAVDNVGNVFVADTRNNAIRKISPEGFVTTLAGSDGFIGHVDGAEGAARFWNPSGVAVDPAGNVLVADAGNRAIRRITPDGVVTTLVRLGTGNIDGLGGAAQFGEVRNVAVDSSSRVYIADTTNNTIRRGAPAVDPARLINVSVLATLTGGNDALTIGAIVGGVGSIGSKPLLVRAAGPSLAAFGVTGLLEDPRLELFAGTAKLNENDNWGGTAELGTTFAQVGAFPFASVTSKDAALFDPAVRPGNASARVSGAAGAVLAELYETTSSAAFTPTTPRLINGSVLKHVGSGLTAGFMIGGNGVKRVLVRAVGPSLAAFGVAAPLSDPTLEVFDGESRVIATNDNWGGDAALATEFGRVGAFALANANSRDAALIITLEPGNYTVHVRGADNSSGIALIEVYELP